MKVSRLAKSVLFSLALAAQGPGQTKVDLRSQSRNLPDGVATYSTGTAIPASCTPPAIHSLVDSGNGIHQVYICSRTNTFSPANYLMGPAADRPVNCSAQQIYLATDTGALSYAPAGGTPCAWSTNTTVLTATYTNEGTTGTSVNKIAKLTGSPSTVVTVATTDSGGAAGICVTGCGNSSTAEIATRGQTSCVFDGATTAGDYVQISSTAAGACHDAGAAFPTSGQVLGRVLSTNGGAGTYALQLYGPEILLPAHAAIHKNSGSDEVATATAAANAIPKAGSDGKLGAGWIPAEFMPVVRAESFGCRGDGASDNTACLESLRSYLVTAAATSMVTVHFSPGTYLYQRGDWLHNVQNVHIMARNTKFTMTTNGTGHAYTLDDYALNFGGTMWSDAPAGSDFSTAAVNNGLKIATTTLGASSVTTVVPADAGTIALGDALIFGFDAQGAATFGPNPKYFEYNVVTAVDAGTGTVTLKYPLKFVYRSDWVDGPVYYNLVNGAARILSLNRTNFKLPQNIIVEGATFVARTGTGTRPSQNGAIQPGAAKQITLIDVNATGIYVVDTDNLTVIRGRYEPDASGNGASEIDKCISRIEWDGVFLSGHTQGTGVLFSKFTNSTLVGQFQNFARNQVYEGNRFLTTPQGNVQAQVAGAYYVQSIDARDNICHLQSAAVQGCFSAGNPVVLNAVNASPAPTSTSFTVPFSANTANALEAGVRMFTSNVASPKFFIVSSFVCDYAANCTINGHASDGTGPAAGDVYTIWTIGRFSAKNTFAMRVDPATARQSIYEESSQPNGGRNTHWDDQSAIAHRTAVGWMAGGATYPPYGSGTRYYNRNVRGYIMKLVIDVQRAYTGSDGACSVVIANASLPSATIGTIDCKTAGLRVFNGNLNGEGKTAGDSMPALPHVFVEQLQVQVGTSDLTLTDEIQTPIISVFVEASPIQ